MKFPFGTLFCEPSPRPVEIAGDASGVTVEPNIVGLNTIGRALLPNGNDGVLIDGTAHDNLLEGCDVSVIPANTFSGKGGYGVAIVGQTYAVRRRWAIISAASTSQVRRPASDRRRGGRRVASA